MSDYLNKAKADTNVLPQRAQAEALISIAESLHVLAAGPKPRLKTLREQIIDAMAGAARGTTSGASADKIIDTLLDRFDITPKGQ